MDDHQPATAQVSDPLATATVHDPLPESTWLWRRVFVFAVSSASALGIFLMVQSMRELAAHNPDLAVKAMLKVIGWVLALNWCNMTYYLVAPTGEQITRWVQTAGMLKQGVQLATSALVSSPSSTAQTTTTAGVGPQPPADPLPTEAPDAAPTAR